MHEVCFTAGEMPAFSWVCHSGMSSLPLSSACVSIDAASVVCCLTILAFNRHSKDHCKTGLRHGQHVQTQPT